MIRFDTPIQMANFDRSGPGITMPAIDLRVGSCIWTKRHDTLELGAWPVAVINRSERPVWRVLDALWTSGSQRFWQVEDWVSASSVGTPDGVAICIGISVEGAGSFIAGNILCRSD